MPSPSPPELAALARDYFQPLASSHYWRAKAANGGKPNGYWTPLAWLTILNAFDWSCAYCGAAPETLHVEHMTPLAAGGANTRDNIVPACPACNASKGKQTALDFIGPEALAAILARHPYCSGREPLESPSS